MPPDPMPQPHLDPDPRIVDNNSDFFFHESGRETDKNESLADDNTTLMITSTENFLLLRQILDKFSRVSGLTCNYEKTNVLIELQ
jgi:hypothetical protein